MVELSCVPRLLHEALQLALVVWLRLEQLDRYQPLKLQDARPEHAAHPALAYLRFDRVAPAVDLRRGRQRRLLTRPIERSRPTPTAKLLRGGRRGFLVLRFLPEAWGIPYR